MSLLDHVKKPVAAPRSRGVFVPYFLEFISPVSYAPHDLALSVEGIGIQTFQVAYDARKIVQYADLRRGEAASQYRLSPFEGPSP